MPDVQFSEDTSAMPAASSSQSSMTKLVISLGLAKTSKEAEYVLMGVVAVALIAAGAILFLALKPEEPPVPQSVMEAALPPQFRTSN